MKIKPDNALKIASALDDVERKIALCSNDRILCGLRQRLARLQKRLAALQPRQRAAA